MLPYIGISVTVIHERAVLADAWTTAMSVLGSQTGIFLADKLGLQVIFVKKEYIFSISKEQKALLFELAIILFL